MVVLLDFSRTFAPYTEQDVSALSEIAATVEELVRTGALEQPTKILFAAFGNDGLSPVRPCGPARVFRQKFVPSSSAADAEVSKVTDLHAWLVSCVKAVKALSSDAQQFTDVSGALSFAAASNSEVNGAKVVIVYTDLREDLPSGHQLPALDLKDNSIVIVSRPGLDDVSQPTAVLTRVVEWSDRLRKVGAGRVCHSSSQSVTKNDIVGCLTETEIIMNDFQSTMVLDVTSPARPPDSGRRSVLAERYDLAVAWMSAALLGMIAISVLPESAGVVRMLLPLVFMCGYLGFAVTRARFSTPKVADSVYFLGFLWTLWALIDVLVGKQDLKAAELYVAFGYALTATASGMFLRLALLQFFRTIDDQEEQAVDRLDEHVARLTNELQVCQKAAATLTTSAGEAFEKYHQDFLVRSERTLDAVTAMSVGFSAAGVGLTDALDTIKTSVTGTGRSFSALDRRLTAATLTVSERLGGAIEALEKRMLELAARLEKIEIRPDVLTSELRKVTVATTASLQPLTELAAETLRQLKASVEEVAVAVKQLPAEEELKSAVKGAAEYLALVSSACSLLADSATKSGVALSGVTHSAEGVKEFVLQSGDSLGAGIRQAQEELQNVSAAAKTVEIALKDVVTFAGNHLR